MTLGSIWAREPLHPRRDVLVDFVFESRLIMPLALLIVPLIIHSLEPAKRTDRYEREGRIVTCPTIP